MTDLRKKFIGDRKFYRMLIGIALPIMVQNGITNFVSLLDNLWSEGLVPRLFLLSPLSIR